MDGARLVGRRGRGRARGRDRPGRTRHRGVDGPAGRVEDGPRAAWSVRRRGAHLLAGLGGALGTLRARSRRPPPPAVAPDARPARARLVRRLPRLLQPRRGLPERCPERPAARVPPRAHGLGRLSAGTDTSGCQARGMSGQDAAGFDVGGVARGSRTGRCGRSPSRRSSCSAFGSASTSRRNGA